MLTLVIVLIVLQEGLGIGVQNTIERMALFEWVRTYRPGTACIYITCHAEYDYMREAMQLGSGLQIAFKKYNDMEGVFGSDWIDFKNFKFLFRTKDAWIMIRNTLGYNIFRILPGIVVGVVAAILLSEVIQKAAKKFYQTAILLLF